MKEKGRIGQKRLDGHFYEEFLPELSGTRGIRVYREMEQNDDTIGAIMFAIKMLIRQVKWHVEPGGDSAKDREAAEFVETCMGDMQSTWTDTMPDLKPRHWQTSFAVPLSGLLAKNIKISTAIGGSPVSRQTGSSAAW